MRNWHRWVGLPAALFLIAVASTGVLLQFQQIFGEEEAEKEKLSSLVSAYRIDSPLDGFAVKLERARTAVKSTAGDDRLDSVEIQLKGEPRFVFHTSGRAAQRFVVHAESGAIIKVGPDEHESFLLRLHSGEVFGDGGLVLGMFWGIALLVLTVTGLILYWRMYKARVPTKGWRKLFW
ncbi:MAG: PepSY-associated TM helix domain-containing protein [Planctomycetota bacterium]|nr:PepSY-associated TM helix domain-containing protein [Planctomycetota bacterium]